MNNYVKTDTEIIFDCGCVFKRDKNRIIFPYDQHNPKHKINWKCPEVFKLICENIVEGIFQLMQPTGKKWCPKVKPEKLEHLSALGSLLRPGCLESKDSEGITTTIHYERRKNGKEEIPKYHPVVDKILSDTYNCLIYQEQAIDMVVKCAGFNPNEADSLRRCVTDDTMFVSKSRGWISIKELLETDYKDYFLVMDQNGKQSWKKISNIWCTGKHDVRKIETNNGLSVKATKYHQFLTNEGWKARRRLSSNDYIVCARNIDFDGYDGICRQLCMVIAGLVTEGYFVEENISHFTNYDSDMMNVFVLNFEQYFGHIPNISDPKVAKISEYDKRLINRYLEYGKSSVKKLPQQMMRTTKETCRHFLSFILSAEGGVTKQTGQFEFSSSSELLVHQVQLLLKRFAIRSNIIKKNVSGYKDENDNFIDCGPTYRLYISSLEDQKLLLKELSIYFPKYKIEDLEINFNRREDGFTFDIVPTNIVKSLLNQYPYLGNYEGGGIYKNNVSRKKINRLCLSINDKYWNDFANGCHYYDIIENVNEKYKQVSTYDFSIEDSETPYIIANGMVIHNSMGKKDVSEMQKNKKMFLEKAVPFGVLNEQQAAEVFNWIEASQRYSFNRSLSENTKVQTPDGEKRIVDLKKGDFVLAPDSNYKDDEYVEVLQLHNHGLQSVFGITTISGGYIQCTLEHKFLCDDKKVRKLKDIIGVHTIKVMNGKFDAISKVEYVNHLSTYDITIKNKHHLFYANSHFITSNSHAMAYGKRGYVCAFEKAHFPRQYYKEWLRNGDREDYPGLVNEAKLFDIQTYPPDIRDGRNEFYVKKKNIYFGLNNIKGSLSKDFPRLFTLMSELNWQACELGKSINWLQFLSQVLEHISSRTAEGLIGAGALDCFGMDRALMLYEYERWNKLLPGEKKPIKNHSDLYRDVSLTNYVQVVIKDKEDWYKEKLSKYKNEIEYRKISGRTYKTELEEPRPSRRLEKLKEIQKELATPIYTVIDTVDSLLFAEENFLGVALTKHKTDEIQTCAETATCLELLQGRQGYCVVKVKIERASPWKCRKESEAGNSIMCFLTISDKTSSMGAVAFADQFSENRHLLTQGNVVFISGKLTKENSFQVIRCYGVS